MKILWIILPGIFVGALVMDSVRRIFSEDDRLVLRLFQDQPVTMIAAAAIVGSVVVWVVVQALGLW